MTGFWIVAVLATLLLAFFVFATVELAALVLGRRAVSSLLRPLAPVALEGTGIARMLGMTFYVAVGIGTQLLALDLLFGRTTELNEAEFIVLVVELVAAVSWTVFLVLRSSVQRAPAAR